MESAVENIKLGACDVTFGETPLGLTKGGVEIAISTTSYSINIDQLGITTTNEFITSRTINVKVPIAETQLELFKALIPGSNYVQGSGKAKVEGLTGIGTSLRNKSDVLTLHPKGVATDDFSSDITIPLASPKGDIQFSFKHDEERIYVIEFVGYVDLENDLLFHVGEWEGNTFQLEDGSTLLLEEGSRLSLEVA